MSSHPKDLLTLSHTSSETVKALLQVAAWLKQHPLEFKHALEGKSCGLIFQKPSNRTRVSFEVGIHQLGGHCLYLGPDEIHLGQRESIADVARTLSRYLKAIIARTFSHEDQEELARTASIPVINGLSDMCHPCQALADIFSIQERFGSRTDIRVAYIGDGNNVCHSLLLACAHQGYSMAVATPPHCAPRPEIVARARELASRSGAVITLTEDPLEAAEGAHVFYADVWVSMGEEEKAEKKIRRLKNYQVNAQLVEKGAPGWIFMHCLPAHRGEEVTPEIIDSPRSIVFDQAENRLHVQKAVLLYLMEPSMFTDCQRSSE